MSRRARTRGFTLIEMIVVISIIVILSALSIPLLNRFGRGSVVLGGARALQTALNDARGFAVTSNRAHRVFFFITTSDMGTPIYGIRTFRDNGVGTNPRFEPVKSYALPEGTILDCRDSNIGVFIDAPPDDLAGVPLNEGLTIAGDGQIGFGAASDIAAARNASNFSLYDTSQAFRIVTGAIRADCVVYARNSRSLAYVDVSAVTGRASIAVVIFADQPAEADFTLPTAGGARALFENPNRTVAHPDTTAESQQTATDSANDQFPLPTQ